MNPTPDVELDLQEQVQQLQRTAEVLERTVEGLWVAVYIGAAFIVYFLIYR